VTSPEHSAGLRDALASVAAPVHLLFFEQSIGCDACTPTRQLLQQLPDLNPNITVEVLNLILEKDRAVQHGVDRVPAIVVTAANRNRIRFYGAPFGLELGSLMEAIRNTASGESGLGDESRAQLATLKEPIRLQVFFTPSCVYCPQMVSLANQLAIESPLISAAAIDATEYPDLVRRYNVNGVPKTVINDTVEIVGAANEADVVSTVLSVAGLK
jgi:glutaredoxin-like protein